MQNENHQIRKKINLLLDRIKKNEKNENRLKQAKKIQTEERILNIFKDIFRSRAEHIRKEINLSKDKLDLLEKKQRLFQNRLKQIATMQNLTRIEVDQIKEIQNQSRDIQEKITKMGIIKNYEEMSKEELIISLLK